MSKKRRHMQKRGKTVRYLLPLPAVYKGAIVRLRSDGKWDVEGPASSVIRFIREYWDWRRRRSDLDSKSGACKNLVIY